MTLERLHDPQAVLDYYWDWGPWLNTGETIQSHVVSILPSGELLVDSTIGGTEAVTAWVSGGRLGRTYSLTCHIVTSQGREDDRSFTLVCANR